MMRRAKKQLSKSQVKAIGLLAQSTPLRDVERKCEINKRTLMRWRKEKLFLAELAKARERHLKTDLKLDPVEAIEALKPLCIAALHTALMKGDSRAAIFVAERTRVFDGARVIARKFKVSFGNIPNDAPPIAPPAPLKIVDTTPKQEQA